MNYKIALLPGDGIGIEVTQAAIKVMEFVAEKFNVKLEFNEYAIGGNSYDKFGTPLTQETLDGCYSSDAVFLGAVGGLQWEKLPHHLKPGSRFAKTERKFGAVR